MIEKNCVVGPFQCNCRILACPDTGDAVIIDPGAEPEKITRAVSELKTATGKPIQVKALLHTHAHLDHIGATRAVKAAIAKSAAAKFADVKSEEIATSSPLIRLHEADLELYKALKKQGEMFGISYDDPAAVDSFLADGEEFQIGKFKMSVIHTPGHSPGGVCFRLHEHSSYQTKETVFSGDTLFYRSVGRTDLWGANERQLIKSIRTRLFTLDGDTRVCPGHGPDSRMGDEKHENPFVGEGA